MMVLCDASGIKGNDRRTSGPSNVPLNSTLTKTKIVMI